MLKKALPVKVMPWYVKNGERAHVGMVRHNEDKYQIYEIKS